MKTTGLNMTVDLPWNTYEEYLQQLEKNKCAINLIPVVGYNNIRIAGGAGFENREPTEEELNKMKGYLTEAMEAGAFGMSTGLIYSPQIFAKTKELIELAKVLGEYGALYFSHIRGEGKNVLDAVKEVIEIVRGSGSIGGQIAHHKIAGKIYWGRSVETLKLIEDANENGLSITCDQYPYNRGMCNLSATLPPWAREGTVEEIKKRLTDPEVRERIKKQIMEDKIDTWENIIHDDGFERVFIVSAPQERWKEIIGKNISEITKIKGFNDDWETYFELLNDDPQVTSEGQGWEDIRRIMTSRYQMVGTDGAGIPHLPSLGAFHPRFYGTYPRILGKFVREENLLTMEDAIRRMTSFPAQRLGLRDRGLLRENTMADIVIFNPETIIDKATFEEPHQFPEGILHVIVNGIIVVENNTQSRKRPGKILRRP
jgi:N-acyl-D-amino-acid deacylase